MMFRNCVVVGLSLLLVGCASSRAETAFERIKELPKHQWNQQLAQTLDRDLCGIKLAAGNKYWSISQAAVAEADRREYKISFCSDRYESCYQVGLMEGTYDFEQCILKIQTEWGITHKPLDKSVSHGVTTAVGSVFEGVLKGVSSGLNSRAYGLSR